MVSRSNYLDSDTSPFENSLRFVKNDFEESFDNMLKDVPVEPATNLPYKIIKPEPGFAVKAYKIIDNDKIFVNICQSTGIPPPEDITTDELTEILKSDMSTFRVPMSITEPRITKDKSNKDANVCDVAIHPDFFKKVERIKLFADFLVIIIFEALENKYNIQVDQANWIILRNRKVVGTLVTHRIQNRDVKQVCDAYTTPPESSKAFLDQIDKDNPKSIGSLIQEIEMDQPITLEYTLIIDDSKNIVAEFYMPNVLVASEIQLSVGGDCISLQTPRRGYCLNEYLPYDLDADHAVAKFLTDTRILTVTIPTISI